MFLTYYWEWEVPNTVPGIIQVLNKAWLQISCLSNHQYTMLSKNFYIEVLYIRVFSNSVIHATTFGVVPHPCTNGTNMI